MKNTRLGKLDGIFEAVVKEDKDFQAMGRMKVWFPEMGSLSSDKDSWITVSYASPYAGSSPITFVDKDNTQTYDGTQTSYGIWMGSPDIGNLVYVFFANGDPSRGFWFACSYGQFSNTMLPNIPSGTSYQYPDQRVPTAEFNKFDPQPNKHEQPKPYHKVHYEAIRNQGLKNDPIRGFSQHGAKSSPASKVYGILTKKGHYISMEDTPSDSKIRIRTVNGGQLLIDDSEGLVYINNNSGTGWVEISAEGKISIYGDDDISLRTKGNLNFYSDMHINMEGKGNINLKAGGNVNTESTNFTSLVNNNFVLNTTGKTVINSTDKVSITSDKDIGIVSMGSFQASATKDIDFSALANMKISSTGNMDVSAVGNLSMGGMVVGVSAQATLGLQATAMLSLVGATIMENSGGAVVPPVAAGEVSATRISLKPISVNDKIDVLQPLSDDDIVISNVSTIVSTFPTHEPCPEHIKK